MGTGRYRFGTFEFDATKLELRREGVLVRLQAQPAQVLACLAERANQVVLREELCQAVWGNKTFVDFDGGLNFCISQLRAALQDDSAQPLYIRTVPKSGYQFIAPIQRVAEGAQEAAQESSGPASRHRKIGVWVRVGIAAAVLVLGAIGATGFLMYLYLTPGETIHQPILAVARFDNETGDPGITKFTDALTDDLVEKLTRQSKDKYRVIGNAQILRLPRDQRDLKAIAESLHAGYLVLGHVQTNGNHLRILAHLIRLPDQTHIWVVRVDQPLRDALNFESEAAERITAEFAARMSTDPSHAASFPPGSH